MFTTVIYTQGVRNRREIKLMRFALPYDYACFADGYSICIRNIQNRLLYTPTPLDYKDKQIKKLCDNKSIYFHTKKQLHPPPKKKKKIVSSFQISDYFQIKKDN